MSEASRSRFLRIKNRLAELNARLGPLEPEEPETAQLDPSWGMLGSLLQLSQRERVLDADLRRLERQRTFSDREPDRPSLDTKRPTVDTKRPTVDTNHHAADW